MQQPDRTYEIQMNKPPMSYFVKKAAGIKKGAMEASKLTFLLLGLVINYL